MTDALTTDRLILRPFQEADFDTILRIASDPDTVKYLYFWGRNGITPQQDAHRFLTHALEEWGKNPVAMREYCVILKETGEAIGDASVEIYDDTSAEIGWILLPEYRGKGYATEAGRAMMDFGFRQYRAQRVIAHCDARNAPSYRVMERLGMTLDHIEKEGRAPKWDGGPRGDEATYAISRMAWAWGLSRRLTWQFDRFFPTDALIENDLRLICESQTPANPEKGYVPAYHFLIDREGETVGRIDLRIGFTDLLFYAGHVGYAVEEKHRGHGYAARACRLLRPLMRQHGIDAVLITNDVRNAASRQVCEKLNCSFLYTADVPEDHILRTQEHQEQVNIYLFSADEP
ncbi:MAG: GNAT family N-acetyltransferase [Clostridia bacterium]|nr:GNAT family N-acetyltransferase [Clostridia bacterium]